MYTVSVDDKEYKIEFDNSETNKGKINNNDFQIDTITSQEGVFHLLKDNKSYNIEILSSDTKKKKFEILINGDRYEVDVKDETDVLLAEMGFASLEDIIEAEMKAPMPGLVIDILVKEGDTIKKGDPLLVLEAMKMENTLKSARDGVIKTIKCKKQDVVDKGSVLLEFEG